MQGAGDVLPDIISADGEFTVTAVDEHGKLDLSGTAEAGDRVHRRADGASFEQHVINEDDLAILNRNGFAAALGALVIISQKLTSSA